MLSNLNFGGNAVADGVTQLQVGAAGDAQPLPGSGISQEVQDDVLAEHERREAKRLGGPLPEDAGVVLEDGVAGMMGAGEDSAGVGDSDSPAAGAEKL